ncbi:MAG: SpoIIIAH-like family protein [Clostridia bacterium]|nr:SpoIIIAH-like family protein [Clostridia bacterium]
MNRHLELKKTMRAVCGAMLLALLGVCGFAGADRSQTQTVSVPVLLKMMDEEAVSVQSVEETRRKLREEREREMELLCSVAENPGSEPSLVQTALKQKTELAYRMEQEASTTAALAYMGFERAAVICGAQTMSVFVPLSYMEQEHVSVRIVDCVCTQTGFEPENVKIILSKNE